MRRNVLGHCGLDVTWSHDCERMGAVTALNGARKIKE